MLYLTKAKLKRLKDAFITAIDGDPVYSVDDATKKIELIVAKHLEQNQGVVQKDFAIKFTFALEQKLTGAKLKRAIDNYHNNNAPGTTKKIKNSFDSSDPDEEENLKDLHGLPGR